MDIDKCLDLRVGDPDFLRTYWRDRLIPLSIPLSKMMNYNPVEAKMKLKSSILEMHNAVQNADTTQGTIVLGIGATQILSAAIYALQQVGAPKEIFVRKPYYYRLPELIEMSGCTPLTRPRSHYTEIVVVPNNPNNETRHANLTSVPDKIFDLCYNWPQYTITKKFNEQIMVFSLAKCTGHASSRIGWAIVKDSKLADYMNHFIEQTTGGPSVESMLRADAVLTHLIHGNHCSDFFLSGRNKLISRWDEISKVSNPFLKPVNESGMFLWTEYGQGYARQDLLFDLNIDSIDGPSSGGRMNQLRLNMGCSDAQFEDLIRRLNIPINEFRPENNP